MLPSTMYDLAISIKFVRGIGFFLLQEQTHFLDSLRRVKFQFFPVPFPDRLFRPIQFSAQRLANPPDIRICFTISVDLEDDR